MIDPNSREQLVVLRHELLDRLDANTDDYAARRMLAQIEQALAALDRVDGVRRSVCAPN